LEHFVGGDMVDDGAILDGAHGQFFFLFHGSDYLSPKIDAIKA
jgi:hypothetical protein